MIDDKEEIFSEEYNTSEAATKVLIKPETAELEQTTVSKEVMYSISKPKRIIIKAIIKND